MIRKAGTLGNLSVKFKENFMLNFLEYEVVEENDILKGVIFIPSRVYEEIILKYRDEIKELLRVGRIELVIKPELKERLEPLENRKGVRFSIRRTGILVGDELNPEYHPSEYIVARCNQEAVDTLEHVIFGIDHATSSVVYGPPGVGKTHLVQAFAYKALSMGMNVVFLRSDTLIRIVSESFRAREVGELARYLTSSVHLFVVDDFQKLDARAMGSIRDFLFSVLDAVLMKNGRVVVTSDVRPSEWRNIEERLVQRLMLYRDVYLPHPDVAFAKTFVKEKLYRKGKIIDERVLDRLSGLFFKSVRDLQRLVDYLGARTVQKVSEGDMEIALVELFGDSINFSHVHGDKTGDVEDPDVAQARSVAPEWLWNTLLYSTLPSDVAQRVARGSRSFGSYRPMVQAIRKAFVDVLLEHGYSLRDIADVVKMKHSTVYYWKNCRVDQDLYRVIKERAQKLLGGV